MEFPLLGCVLLLHHSGSLWGPLIAIPGVIAGAVVSIYMILDGMKGLAKPRTTPRAHRIGTDRVLRWIGNRPQPQ